MSYATSWLITLLALSSLCFSAALAQWDIRGNVSLQAQWFPNESNHSATQTSNLSLSTETEFFRDIGDNASLTITPFARIDQRDEERSHVDLREFTYAWFSDNWEARLGLGKVFWGVAESSNPVDVINQFDSIENDDSSAKLGQPMINLLLLRDWGEIDLYLLPGFRERTFPGADGRPRPATVVDIDDAQFESSQEERHIDFAGRVSGAVDAWDWGLHLFHGTARTPEFRFNPDNQRIVPFYYQNTQVGLDVQATLESWLLKAEIVYRRGDEIENHSAWVSGFEYSFYDLRGSGADIGLVTEWLYDDRAERSGQPFQNDALIGLRMALNDEQSLEGLLGVISDLDGGGQLISLEGSRRFGSNVKASLQFNLFNHVNDDQSLQQLSDEDNLQIDIAYFF